ncbi:MAG: alpha/beta hydrolase [Filimonas sp.]|nr:alpha/beta hydrolase [Filimonas sp.]
MKRLLLLLFLSTSIFINMNAQSTSGHYADINGLKLYYEIHGEGYPLVLLHGGGSTIESTFGRILPELAKKYKVIAVELQAHGHTLDIDRPLSFEQDADDVAALLKHLQIGKANIFGFSNGATTSLQVAIRHSSLVNKLILAAATYKRTGLVPGFFDGFETATLSVMPKPLVAAYMKANSDSSGLQRMFSRDVERMKHFKDIPDTLIHGIKQPALVINGDKEVILPEHALELSRTLQHGELLIVPGNHGEYIGEICSTQKDDTLQNATLLLIKQFLDK